MTIDRQGNGQADDGRLAHLMKFEKGNLVFRDPGTKAELMRMISSGPLRRRIDSLVPLKETGENLLMLAVEADDLELIEMLLKAGADPNRGIGKPTEVYPENEPPLRWVESVEAARLLLDAGADPNLRDGVGNPPLVRALDGRLHDLTRLLLERGADPLARDAVGESLVSSARRDAPESFQILLPIVLERLRATPGRALTVEPKRAGRDFVRGFAKQANDNWVAVTTPLGAERLTELVLAKLEGTRVERDAKDRRVLAFHGVFVFKQRNVPHSTALIGLGSVRLPRLERTRDLCAACARESKGPTCLLTATFAEELTNRRVKREVFWKKERPPYTRSERKQILDALEAFCAERSIHIPPCADVGDGLQCELFVQEGTEADYEPFHIVVTADAL